MRIKINLLAKYIPKIIPLSLFKEIDVIYIVII